MAPAFTSMSAVGYTAPLYKCSADQLSLFASFGSVLPRKKNYVGDMRSRRPSRNNVMEKELYFNKDGSAIEKLQTGVNKLADLVGVTLGPKGHVVLESKYGSPKIVNDGVTVAQGLIVGGVLLGWV